MLEDIWGGRGEKVGEDEEREEEGGQRHEAEENGAGCRKGADQRPPRGREEKRRTEGNHLRVRPNAFFVSLRRRNFRQVNDLLPRKNGEDSHDNPVEGVEERGGESPSARKRGSAKERRGRRKTHWRMWMPRKSFEVVDGMLFNAERDGRTEGRRKQRNVHGGRSRRRWREQYVCQSGDKAGKSLLRTIVFAVWKERIRITLEKDLRENGERRGANGVTRRGERKGASRGVLSCNIEGGREGVEGRVEEEVRTEGEKEGRKRDARMEKRGDDGGRWKGDHIASWAWSSRSSASSSSSSILWAGVLAVSRGKWEKGQQTEKKGGGGKERTRRNRRRWRVNRCCLRTRQPLVELLLLKLRQLVCQFLVVDLFPNSVSKLW
jgi:hypothetical protein